MRAFGFSFTSFKGWALFLGLLLIFVFVYHGLIQRSVRAHPEQVRSAVLHHCHYMVGKRLGQIPPDEVADERQRCENFTIQSVEAAGGLVNPVIVRIRLDASPEFPLADRVFIFKSAVINFHFLAGLSGLMGGGWEFNFYNTYSDLTFSGSI